MEAKGEYDPVFTAETEQASEENAEQVTDAQAPDETTNENNEENQSNGQAD